MQITIFTPSYNRAYLLPRLYESLLIQDNKNFEWIIVDDGSSDNTKEVVNGFIQEGKINITFETQQNSGKHIAINRGVELAKGELFFIVDSDDYLTIDALQVISDKYTVEISEDPSIAGICGRKGYSETKPIGSEHFSEDFLVSSLDFRYKLNMKGDMAEVIKTNVIREFPFPVIEGEKFCTEGLIWSRVAEHHKFLFFSKIIYIAEYLEGGLSDSIVKVRIKSPNYAILFYSELEKMKIPLLQKIKANINFWRFAKYTKLSFSQKLRKVNLLNSVLGIPISVIFSFKDPKI